LITGRLDPDSAGVRARRHVAEQLLGVLADHLAERGFLVESGYSVADIAVYSYVHVAGDAGLTLPGAVGAWIERVAAQPGFMNDLDPYPANAQAGESVSIYDA
jgi:glutathione S-transferase